MSNLSKFGLHEVDQSFRLEESYKFYIHNLKKEKYFITYDYDVKLHKLADLFSDINALHPFREGNGRSQRVFIESLAKINGINLDLTNVSKMNMIVASHESINGDYKKLKEMFKSNSHNLSEEERLEYINIYIVLLLPH